MIRIEDFKSLKQHKPGNEEWVLGWYQHHHASTEYGYIQHYIGEDGDSQFYDKNDYEVSPPDYWIELP